jgi:hypothetical protein
MADQMRITHAKAVVSDGSGNPDFLGEKSKIHYFAVHSGVSDNYSQDNAYYLCFYKVRILENQAYEILEKREFSRLRKSWIRTDLRRQISDQKFYDFLEIGRWFDIEEEEVIERDMGLEFERIFEYEGKSFEELVLRIAALGTNYFEFLEELGLEDLLDNFGEERLKKILGIAVYGRVGC